MAHNDLDGRANQADEMEDLIGQPTDEAHDEIVQVVYHSNNSGSLVGVESSLISAPISAYDYGGAFGSGAAFEQEHQQPIGNSQVMAAQLDCPPHQPITRSASTLPSVAEETSSGAGPSNHNTEELMGAIDGPCIEDRSSRSISRANEHFLMDDQAPGEPADSCCVPAQCADPFMSAHETGNDYCMNPEAIYSTIGKRHPRGSAGNQDGGGLANGSALEGHEPNSVTAGYLDCGYDGGARSDQAGAIGSEETRQPPNYVQSTGAGDTSGRLDQKEAGAGRGSGGANRARTEEEKKDIEEINAEICQIISRQKQGAAESGSLRGNFRRKKKLVVSSSTSNETDLIAHRQRLVSSREAGSELSAGRELDHDEEDADSDAEETVAGLPLKFKRTHSVSFNVGSARNSRHSVDIRNLPSYLSVKRASIVDVARGAMSSLMQSFGGGGGGGGGGTAASSVIGSSRRTSGALIDEEPIFEEPIAPTLSLGQRVALVKNNGAEFGTVGWIGQLADVEDDWVVGVIFDNMIGNCDGAYNGVRYFYSRENFAMFVPLAALTKTDNYIGRPETGTMLSRMSVSLKPGQLISIQRSSIRLQHCFLNAPHQRVGHDVRAVSNRLHCQCHNCGPCAHLTKQHSRVSALPAFGAHHVVNKKNSLAHAAVEILAHHHHHYHEEEHHDEEDYQFGDNAAHACNFVRYSCCQQNGRQGHEFASDCGLVRPELLDNLIHAPRAPHRRSARPRRVRRNQQVAATCEPAQQHPAATAINSSSSSNNNNNNNIDNNTLEAPIKLQQIEDAKANHDAGSQSPSACSTCSSRSVSPAGPDQAAYYSQNTNSYQVDSLNYMQESAVCNTLDSKMSLHDQQRFIYRRESSSIRLRRRDEANEYANESSTGFIPRLRRCFGCLRSRGHRGPRRVKKRKLSARNRLIEFRRKQSTFVPSTLAKPQDDFASHGIILPAWDSNRQQEINYNSDYSSYSKSSGSESPPDDSPSRTPNQQDPSVYTNYALHQVEQQFISIDHDVRAPTEQQLKSSNTTGHEKQFSYNDYTFDNDGGYRSYEKLAHSQESDLGFYDHMTNSSGGTLKNIVDQAIDKEESLQHLDPIETISPIRTESISNSCCDQVEISSPTVSIVDQVDANDLSDRLEVLDIDKETANSNL